MIRITDKAFKYVPAAATNVARTFQRERKRIAEEKAAQEAAEAEARVKVKPIKKGATA